MRLLVSIDGNGPDWATAAGAPTAAPRLPLPYAFGAAFKRQGHYLTAIDMTATGDAPPALPPFERMYAASDVRNALRATEIAMLWAADGIRALANDRLLHPLRRRVILSSFVWRATPSTPWRSRRLMLATRAAARFARAVVFMTREQAEQARADVSPRVAVVHLQCGVDTAFYCVDSSIDQVPESEREAARRAADAPFALMLGDEQRLNEDALQIATDANVRVVRVCKSLPASTRAWLLSQITHRGLAGRFVLHERTSYEFTRYLMHHALAYLGLVDATWQPAGWTATCEALASGLPIVLYEGLVSRELARLGAAPPFVYTVPLGHRVGFCAALDALRRQQPARARAAAQVFARAHLNMETTSARFVADIEALARAQQA